MPDITRGAGAEKGHGVLGNHVFHKVLQYELFQAFICFRSGIQEGKYLGGFRAATDGAVL